MEIKQQKMESAQERRTDGTFTPITSIKTLPELQPQAKTTALETLIIYLTHLNANPNLLDSERHLLLQLVNPLVA